MDARQRRTYAAVAPSESAADAHDDDYDASDVGVGESRGPGRRQRQISAVSRVMHSVVWLLASVVLFGWTRMDEILAHDARVDWNFLSVALLAIAVILLELAYMTVWIPCVGGVDTSTIDYLEYCPRAVYTTVGASLVTWIFSILGLFPVYGFMTFIVVSVFGMASILSTNLIPPYT